jgi:hypothetical protein
MQELGQNRPTLTRQLGSIDDPHNKPDKNRHGSTPQASASRNDDMAGVLQHLEKS